MGENHSSRAYIRIRSIRICGKDILSFSRKTNGGGGGGGEKKGGGGGGEIKSRGMQGVISKICKGRTSSRSKSPDFDQGKHLEKAS